MKKANEETEHALFVARFVSESDAIEGIKNESDKLYRQYIGTSTAIDGHLSAMMFLEGLHQQCMPIFESVILRVQEYITSDQSSKSGGPRISLLDIGHFRTCGVRVGGRICPDCRTVPALMRKWLADVWAWQERVFTNTARMNVQEIARLHFAYEHIHPFADGNGRSGRALAYCMFLMAGLKPFIFTSQDRFETYYECFEDSSAMENYFLARFSTAV